MKVYESDLHTKVQNYHMKIRSDFRKESSQAFRKQMIKNLDNRLSDIISQSDRNVTNEILSDLIAYANNDTQKSIIQIGNLILDNKNLIPLVKDKLIPGKNQYWSWLIKVMIHKCPELAIDAVEWVSSNFLKKKITFIMKENLMESLVIMTSEENFCEILTRNPQFITQIYKSVLSNCQTAYQLGFSILANLVAYNNTITDRVISTLQMKLNQILYVGFLKSQTFIRQDTAMILANLTLNGFLPNNDVMNLVFIKSTKQKQIVIEQLSYFFLNAGIILPLQYVQSIAASGLIDALRYYFTSNQNVLIENGLQILKSILKRLRNDVRGYKAFYHFLQKNEITQLADKVRQIQDDEDMSIEEYLIS